MSSIETRIAIRGMVAGAGARPTESHPGRPPHADALVQSGQTHTPTCARTDVSFSTYGPRNEHISIVIRKRETGEVICAYPSRELQKLHVHLDETA